MALVVLAQLIDLYMLIVLGAVIISWLSGLDFSPLVLLIALQFLRRLL